jgi:hypothetical protein
MLTQIKPQTLTMIRQKKIRDYRIGNEQAAGSQDATPASHKKDDDPEQKPGGLTFSTGDSKSEVKTAPEPVQSQNTVFTPETQFAPSQPQPVAAPVPAKEPANAGLIVLQWLTYAFWGWTVLALSFLTTSVVANFIDSSYEDWFSSYGIAAVLVLLPISYICDSFYAKKEPAKKVGAETVVMVIHAVIFALFGIGALITAVISLVILFTSSGGSQGALISLISALIISVFYAITFLRTLNPGMVRWLQYKYKLIMLVAVGLIALLGLIGPVANERLTRDDRLLVAELPALSNAINDYARENDRLPDDLEVLSLRGDTKQLVSRKLVEYKPEESQTATRLPATTFDTTNGTNLSRQSNSLILNDIDQEKAHRYQLCVVYKKESRNRYNYGGADYSKDPDGYATYLSVYEHPEGRTCYKLKTTDY